MKRIIIIALVIGLLFTVACSKETKTISLTVSAAASLKGSMEEIKQLYAKENPKVVINYNFGASGSLQQQIEQGADVDLFISAAVKQMNALQDKELIIDKTKKDLLGNKLVLVVPKDSQTTITDFKGLANDEFKKIALGEPKSVPAGQYAEEVLTKLNILESIKPKAVYGKDVKEVLTWVESGNADAGIVYETDAKSSDKVKKIAVAPAESHTPITYPAAIVKASKNADVAKGFLTFLSSDKAKVVFEKYGFDFIAK
jgi:molybdate transport system substrate-binding protein